MKFRKLIIIAACAMTLSGLAVGPSALAATSGTVHQAGATAPAAQPVSALTYRAVASIPVSSRSQVVNPDSLSQCGLHSLCLWNYRDFSNTFWQFTLNNPYNYNTWYYVGDSANNKATSLYNNREYCTVISRYYPPDNEVLKIPGGTALNYLGNFTWPHSNNVSVNNSISGFELLNGC